MDVDVDEGVDGHQDGDRGWIGMRRGGIRMRLDGRISNRFHVALRHCHHEWRDPGLVTGVDVLPFDQNEIVLSLDALVE